MSFIRTFNGDINPEELGVTYSHEHIVCRPPYWVEKEQDDLILDNPEASLKEVLDFKKLGGESIVDATAVDYGRDIRSIADISNRTGVNIIGTAGFNKGFLWSAKIPDHLKSVIGDYGTYEQWIDATPIDKLADFVINEVQEGLEGTGCKAGQVKFGTGYNSISPLEEKTLRAVARAHHHTKAPMHSHTEAGTMALEQIQLLKEENVDLSFMSFGHMDRNLDPFYHNKVAETGAFLSFDGISKIKYAPESERIRCIFNLVDKGFEDQILVSGDTARKSYFKHYDHGLGFHNILGNWVPRFKEEAKQKGYDAEKLVRKFFIDNPKRCFTFKK
ncbi:MAG TPA: phosphotriesterase [Candidatus Salinicoccus stercoripullorum]|uniref:Phosphotriesterase n=1 Tax=Candidatus Salinicoccus stercoripullorum TaxID=2838756 RepID=A0A9D1QI46_9STAP|nr:phosphotriesterase [Candidatus Salinicoccus stercoripullorum]